MKTSDIIIPLATPLAAYLLFTDRLSGLLFVAAAAAVTAFPVWLAVRIYLWRLDKELLGGSHE